MTAATLVQHKHCPSCGKAILPSKTTCGGDCEVTYARMKRNRRWIYRGYTATAIVLVLFYVFTLSRSAGGA